MSSPSTTVKSPDMPTDVETLQALVLAYRAREVLREKREDDLSEALGCLCYNVGTTRKPSYTNSFDKDEDVTEVVESVLYFDNGESLPDVES